MMNPQDSKSFNPAVVLDIISLIFSFVLLIVWVLFAINPDPGQEAFDDWLDVAIPTFIFCLALSLIAVGTALGAMVLSGITKRARPLTITAFIASIGPWITLLVLFFLPS